MSHGQCTWLDCIPLPPPHSTPSLLYPLNGSIPCNPPHGVQFGHLAEQSAIAGYDPNDPVEVSSTEATTMLLPSGTVSIGSTYNSGEDIATALASSEVDERPNWRMLASPMFTQKEESSKCSLIRDLSLQIKCCVNFITHSKQYRDTCGDVLTPEKIQSRILDFLELQADHAAQGEQAAPSKLSEAEYHTRLLLEEQKNHLLSDARSEMNVQESWVESADSGLSVNEAYRFSLNAWNFTRRVSHLIIPGEEDWIGSVQNWSKEKALQDTRMRTLQESEELTKNLLYRS